MYLLDKFPVNQYKSNEDSITLASTCKKISITKVNFVAVLKSVLNVNHFTRKCASAFKIFSAGSIVIHNVIQIP